MLKAILSFITLFICLTIICSISLSEPYAQQSKPQGKTSKLSQQKTSTQENPPQKFITQQQLIDAFTRAIDANKEKANTQQNPPPPDNSSWWFSLFLVIFTFGLVVVGGVQCYIIFNTLKETQKAANAADASAKALPIMERAYIFSNIKIDRKIEVGAKEFNAVLYLKNHGKTPAIIKEIGFMGYKEPSDDPIRELHIHHPIDSIIGSGDEFEEDHYWFVIKETDWHTLITTKPQIKFFCLGYVKYITVFGEEDCHAFYWEFYVPDLRFVLVQSEELNHNT